jgi:hypothetical protein
MKRRGGACVGGLALAGCLLAAACGRSFGGAAGATSTTAGATTTIPPTTTRPQLRGGYLSSDSIGGIFVQITMTSATEFEGSVAVHLEFRDGTVDERNHFTGVLSQTDLIFRFDDSPDWRWGLSWSGSLDSSGFTMSLPTGAGSLAALAFREADVEEYNRAVKQAKPAKP